MVNLDVANEIYSMKDLPMNDFEAKIWNSYGKKFCEESDRSQYLDWDSQKPITITAMYAEMEVIISRVPI